MKHDILPDAHCREGGAPVPAEGALLFAQEVDVAFSMLGGRVTVRRNVVSIISRR